MGGLTDISTSARVVDLRGLREPARAPSVLADPTGRRARRLRAAGRIVGSLLLLWLCSLVLAGLGLLPVAGVPLAGTFRAADEPAQVSKIANPLAPPVGRLGHARPVPVLREAIARGAHGVSAHGGVHGAKPARADSHGARHGEASASRGHHGGGNTRSRATTSAGSGTSQPTSHSSVAGSPATSSTQAPSTTHGSGRGTVTPPASSSGTTHGQSGQPHGASSTSPGHMRSGTVNGPPAG